MSDARVPVRVVRTRFPSLRDDHLRSLAQWGLVRPTRDDGGASYSFVDLATLREVHEALAQGLPLKAIVRQLLAARQGQLTLFDGAPVREEGRARVVTLAPRTPPAGQPPADASPVDVSRAEEAFERATTLEASPGHPRGVVMQAYRDALAFDPALVPALINLGNLHYGSGHLPEAAALYLQALQQAPDSFEAWFNLGHTHHDEGRFAEAVRCYARALELGPESAEACFYLAVAYEKLGRSQDARPLWQRYQRLAPEGEWIALAREFGE
ncbi:tetratricopeptide repeat protein [Luteitalea sp.]|jgi:DNA-binding transcriptional MerR regulator|uniref:tetratricopeptide repeat protein n=1 Tax=Luteitalea sp. TaxID=2004800 RepID=UPI0037C7463F